MSKLLLAALALLAAAPAAGEPSRPAADPQVRIAQGLLVGRSEAGVRIFKGVPYAAPPLGELRWAPPAAAPGWTSPRRADAFGPSCPQVPFAGDQQPLPDRFDEDCLTLNIWAPARRGRHAVMVWIHGGGFLNGGSAAASTDGRALARKGVVLVSFNYRLGRLGFFAHPALSAGREGEPLGNYGLMDQFAALRWVKANIAVFGGDPANITIFGESAGGGSVTGILASPSAKGLFAKAIIQSGGGRSEPIAIRGPSPDGGPSMEEIGATFARGLGIEGADASALGRLRALPADAVIGGVNMLNNSDRSRTVNWTLDGVFARQDPITAMRTGLQSRVPVLIGANSNELGAMPSIDAIAKYALGLYGEDAPRVEAAYREREGGGLRHLPSDAVFVEPARFMAKLLGAAGQPVYHYSFGYVATADRARLTGARHASDIPYVFDNADTLAGVTDEDRRMADAISDAWVCFARTGDPGCRGWSWPRYDRTGQTLVIDGPAPRAVPEFDRKRLDLIERYYESKRK